MRLERKFTVILLLLCAKARSDELIYSYEGDVLPYDASAGWIVADACAGEDACTEHLGGGFFSLEWSVFGNFANYHLQISTPETLPAPEPPFWVEWRFWSLKPLENTPGQDGRFSVLYRNVHNVLDLFGDAVLSFDGGTVRRGFTLGEFRTHRLETPDGGDHCFFVNGRLFVCDDPGNDNGYSSLQFGGRGPIAIGEFNRNSWDYVRYGRISYGEQIIASEPPEGFVDARVHAQLDRFTVTFDEPNYVLVDEITINVAGAQSLRDEWTKSPLARHGGSEISAHHSGFTTRGIDIPAVSATGRRDNGAPDEVEIVLDRPIPFNATTRFTFDDGVAVNIVEFTFAPGDTNGDGHADLADFSYLQNCFAEFPLQSGPCSVLDMNGSSIVDEVDYSAFSARLTDPQ